MKDRSRSVYDFALLIVIVCAVALATVTVYSQGQGTPQTQGTPAAAAQSPRTTPTPSPTPTPVNWSTDPTLKRFVFRSIGPASMGGRIDDIAVAEQNPYIIYIAFATNGVWKSTNNGTTFQPIFDIYGTHSVGDVAVAPSDPNIVWVGTGEPNNRQSSSFGDGIYKSVDAGKTFTKMGLEDSQTIARIVIDPKDPNTVYAAVLGHLFGPNKERGVYKTTDGGRTWTNVKFLDEDTGFTDIAMDASDNKILYAASYQRRRTNFGFNGGGPGSGIWKTIDAGKTWKKLEGGGLPEGILGRIGLDVSRSNPNVLYAQMEVGPSTGTGGEDPLAAQAAASPSPSPSPSASAAPSPSPAASPSPSPPNPKRSGVWRSDDKGRTWRIVSNENNRPMYYSQIRVDPKNPETVYVGGLNFSKSTDGGKTFRSLQGGLAHVDNHAIWVNPANSDHLLVGNDGGLNVSYDQGATWEFVNTIPAAQFYAIGVDMRKPYYVYGGLQDNGSWGGPSMTRNQQAGITNADWFRVGGGDGFYTQIDPTDHNIVYVESQGGAMQRLDLRTGRSVSIRPRGVPRRGGPGRQGGGPGGAAPAASSPSPAASPTPDTQAQLAEFAARQGFGGFGGGNLASNVVPTPSANEVYR